MIKNVKNENSQRDDTLFGLLLSYKSYNTYLRVFINETDQAVYLVLTSNPRYWSNLPEEIKPGSRGLKRLEIGVERLFIKYILPEHLIKTSGPIIGINIPSDKILLDNHLRDKGYYVIKTSQRYLPRILKWIKRVTGMSPQKKYEIHEKCILEDMEG